VGAEPASAHPFRTHRRPPAATPRTRRVELHELDALQHVNTPIRHYLEQAAHDAVVAAGLDDRRRSSRPAGRFRARSRLEYLDAALPDERLTVVSWPVAL